MAPDFLHNKVNSVGVCQIYETLVPMSIYPLHHGVFYYPLLLTFHLQIAFRKVRNFQIGVEKLVGKVLLN